MSPQEIQRLLTEACPELTWVIDGDFVCAEGVRFGRIRAFYGPCMMAAMWPDGDMLRLARADGTITRTLHPRDLRHEEVAATVSNMFTEWEARESFRARRLIARVQVETRRSQAVSYAEGVTRSEATFNAALAELRRMTATLDAAARDMAHARSALTQAEKALAAAEAHAAKVGA